MTYGNRLRTVLAASFAVATLALGACSDETPSVATDAPSRDTGPSATDAPSGDTGPSTEASATDAPAGEASPATEPSSTDAPSEGDGATPGGNLTIVSFGEMTCADPWQTVIRVALQWQRQLYDSLLYEDREGVFHPWLAESFEVNEDATEFRFTLRDDVTFSDGSPLDAETVRANLDALSAEPRYTIAQGFLASYVGTEVEDPRTVVVSFSEPNAPFLYGLSTPNMSLSSTESAGIEAGLRCEGEASGSGPFTLDSRRSGEQAVLVRNDDYAWAPATLANQGAAYLDSITINNVTDQTIIAQAGLSGDAQIVHGFADSFRPQLEEQDWQFFNEPDPAAAGGFIFYPGRGIAGTNESVRRAFNLALDRAEYVAATGSSTYRLASGVLNSAHPFFVDQSDLLTLDLDAAIDILEADGWLVGPDGIREKDGQRLTIETVVNPVAADAVAVAAQRVAEAGIELTIRPATFQEEQALRAEGQIESRINTQTGAEPTVLTLLFDGNLPPGVDELVVAHASTIDFEQRSAAVDELAALLLEDGWLAPVWEQVNQPAWAADVQGVVRDIGGLWMMSQLSLDPGD